MVQRKQLVPRDKGRASAPIEDFRGKVDELVSTAASQEGLRGARRTLYWCRGPARVHNAEVILDEEAAQRYLMLLPNEVVFDLAELADVPHMAPAFVRRYGLLWHGAKDLGSGGCREHWADWREEIRMLRMTLLLYQRLGEAMRLGTSEPLRRGEFWWPEEFTQDAEDEEYLANASREVAHSINEGLAGCEIGLVSTLELNVSDRGPMTFRLAHNCPNLLAGAYERLALLVASRTVVNECPGCGKLFPPGSGKQKYCTKACSNRSRQRSWKAAH